MGREIFSAVAVEMSEDPTCNSEKLPGNLLRRQAGTRGWCWEWRVIVVGTRGAGDMRVGGGVGEPYTRIHHRQETPHHE